MEKKRIKKGLILDEALWGIEILFIIIIIYGLLTISGLTVNDMLDYVGSTLTEIVGWAYNSVKALIW